MRGVEKLLEAGESIDVRDNVGHTLLHRASEEVHIGLLLSLIQRRGNATASREKVVIAYSISLSTNERRIC